MIGVSCRPARVGTVLACVRLAAVKLIRMSGLCASRERGLGSKFCASGLFCVGCGFSSGARLLAGRVEMTGSRLVSGCGVLCRPSPRSLRDVLGESGRDGGMVRLRSCPVDGFRSLGKRRISSVAYVDSGRGVGRNCGGRSLCGLFPTMVVSGVMSRSNGVTGVGRVCAVAPGRLALVDGNGSLCYVLP